MKIHFGLALAIVALVACQPKAPPASSDTGADSQIEAEAAIKEPIVIAHRGASGYRPEHTLEAYKLAIEQGADFIEPDLVLTKDGIFIARHENEIGSTTNVADHPEFADRKTTKSVEAPPHEGWYSEDFTLAELKTLRSKERLPQFRPQNTEYDNQFDVPTLEEIIDFTREQSKIHNRPIGLYIELKHPAYFSGIDLPMEEAFLKVLEDKQLNALEGDIPIYIQCFWPQSLMQMRDKTELPLVYLFSSQSPPEEILKANGLSDWSQMYSAEGLKRISSFADGVGPSLDLVLPSIVEGERVESTLIADAHEAGLKVHAWTLRSENMALPEAYRKGDPSQADYAIQTGNIAQLASDLFAADIDGLFSDNPDIIVQVRDELN